MEKLDNPTQEEWFAIWLDELVRLGYVRSYTRHPETFILSEEVSRTILTKKLIYKDTKRETIKEIRKKEVLLKACTYTPDFLIVWNTSAHMFYTNAMELLTGVKRNYFVSNRMAGTQVSYVDVKAPAGYGGTNRSDVSFPVKQKWLYQTQGILVNKVMLAPNKKVKVTTPYLWLETFTPNRYLFTDKLTKQRTIRYWSPKKALEFIQSKTNLQRSLSHASSF